MREIRFSLPEPPVAWQRARTNGKRRFTPPKVAAYKESIAWAAKVVGCTPVADVPVEIDVAAVFARPKSLQAKRHPSWLIPHAARPDVDNLAKAVMDALNGVAYVDDGQVCSLRASKWYAERDGQPRVMVTLRFPVPI